MSVAYVSFDAFIYKVGATLKISVIFYQLTSTLLSPVSFTKHSVGEQTYAPQTEMDNDKGSWIKEGTSLDDLLIVFRISVVLALYLV
jgi:hypothetical protein